MRRALAGLALLLAGAPVTRAADVSLVPEADLRLRAVRYLRDETEFHWSGWIGGGASLLQIGGVSFHGSADVETVIGGEKRTFDANQANYHLETGLRAAIGEGDLGVFFHHVSRHYVDRPKVQAVDWNLVGLRGRGHFPERWPLAGHFEASLGHTTLDSLVGYRWEATLALEADLVRHAWGALYLRADLRLVTREPSQVFPDDGFLDLAGEVGLRLSRGPGALAVFAGWEQRNDVMLEVPGRRQRAVVGLRIGATIEPPRPPPRPPLRPPPPESP